ncbi:hypothetical protein BJF77_15825 [Kocuria sp. CNJ-770]|uniref:hypothetical protein n=1 Tax=Kocuria sp. CNJ-770 TaxID=1904964 RepID=UPI00095DC2C9|nr:hypothetical protein [Kocuria sp. CNJ-770]OLT06221.1 hypothetical protein BJF77_15825 [Kocuria sp. CNJ-770]
MTPTPDTPRSSTPTPEEPEDRTASTDATPDGLAGAAAQEQFAEAVEHRLAEQTSQNSTATQDQSRLEEDEESPAQADNPE